MAHGVETKSTPKRPPLRLPDLTGAGPRKPPAYHPAVAAHDIMARDARQAPYVSVLSHPNVRSVLPPHEQIRVTTIAQHGKLTPQQSSNLAKHIASIPHPAERITLAQRANEMGVLPVAAIPVVADAIHKLDPGKRTNIIKGFPRLDQPTNPAVAKELEDSALARGKTLPANPTLGDLYQAKYGPKPDGWSGIITNFPRDFAMTPIYAAEGGYALGHALNQGVTHGDWSGVREIAAQQVDAIRHPKDFIINHPFQTGLALLGGAKGVGRAGVVTREAVGAAPLEATPRRVPILNPETRLPLDPVGGEVPSIPRGELDTRNLTTRGAQKLSDAILAKNPRLQSRAINQILKDARAEARAKLDQERAPQIKAYQEARRGITRGEAQRMLENEARGITPAEHAAFRGQEDPGLKPPTPAMERFHQAALGMENADVTRLKQMGLLTDTAATRRAWLPAVNVAARAGDETAARLLEHDAHAQQLFNQLKDAPHATDVRSEYERVTAQRDADLALFQAKHVDAPTPLRVPEEPMKRVQSPFARAGGGSGIAALKRRVKPTGGPYNAVLFRHGTYQPITDEAFLRDRALPSRVEQAYRFAAEVSNPQRGIVKRAQPGDVIPEGYVLQKVRDQANPLADEIEATSGAAPATTPLQSLMSTFDLSRINDAARVGKPATVPRGSGEYRLWPVSAYNELAQMRSLNPPTSQALINLGKAGQGLRNALLYSRPAYPLTNAVSNMAQTALVLGQVPGGSSYGRALDKENFPVPARIEGTGTAAVNFDALGSSSIRNAWADRSSNLAGAARVALHPIARYTQGIYHSSVAIEDWTRRAAYLKTAIPEARRLAHPDHNVIQRFAASFRPADAAVKETLRHMAEGRTPEARAAAERAVTKVNQALGDFAAMGDHRALGVVVPFWRWTRFVGELMGKTLPLHYPGRTLFLYRLGSLGQAAQHQIGSLTPSLQGLIPLSPTSVITTQRVNPFATLGQNLLPSQGQTALDPSRAVSNLNPLAQMGYTIATGRDPVTGIQQLNQYGRPIHGTDYLRLAGAQGVDLLPPARAFAPLIGGGKTNAPATSINFPGLVQEGPTRHGPQQPNQDVKTNLFGQIAPVSIRHVDLALMARKGDQREHANLLGDFKAARKRRIEDAARTIAKREHVDLSNRNTPAAQRVLMEAIAQTARH